MNPSPERSLISIDPNKINIGRDAPLRFRRFLPGEEGGGEAERELIESVRKHGIIQPPLLQGLESARPGDLLVIQGFRRLGAARGAGLGGVEALLVKAGSLPDRDLVSLWLEGIRYGEPLSELEKITLTKKAAENPGGGWPDLLSGISKAAGRELSQDFIERVWRLLDLDEPVLDSLHRGNVSTADLLLLSENPLIDTREAVSMLSGENLNRREQKEAVRLLLRIADQGEEAWKEFASKYDKSGGVLLEALREACLPTLAEDLERIELISREMHLPPGAGLVPPENLEGGSYRLNVRVRDEESLALTIEKLRDALDSGSISKLLGILKGRRAGLNN